MSFTGTEECLGPMVRCTTDNMQRVARMAKARSSGPMAVDSQVHGRMASNMDLVNSAAKRGSSVQVSGHMAVASGGSMTSKVLSRIQKSQRMPQKRLKAPTKRSDARVQCCMASRFAL